MEHQAHYYALASTIARDLAGVPELAHRWGLTEAWVTRLVERPSFPRPLATINGRPVWSVYAADDWRNAQPRARRRARAPMRGRAPDRAVATAAGAAPVH